MMNNPFRNKFYNAKTAHTICGCFLNASFLLGILILLNKHQTFLCEDTIHAIEITNAVIIVLYTVCSIISNYLFFKAENHRRGDLVDNSLGTKLCEKRSENYYSNDNIAHGIKKMAINNFESCFFTRRIINHGLLCKYIYTGFFSITMLSTALFGLNDIVLALIQVSLPVTIICETVRYKFLTSQLEQIEERYRSLFSGKGARQADYIKNILQYETTIAWANILLSEKTYKALNKELSAEWEQMKKEYQI